MVQQAFNLVAQFCIRSRFQQLKFRLGLPPGLSWDEAKSNPKFGKQITNGVLRILRIAGFLKYITLYPTYQNSSYPV